MPTGPSLYDMLLGHIGGEPLSAHSASTLEVMSVMRNVERILNTRAGSLKHVPGFGLPDLTNIYRALPASAHLLKQQMEATLLAYEPRIGSVDIEIDDALDEEPDPGITVRYVMTCHLRKTGLVRFGTYFEPTGRLRLQYKPRQRVEHGKPR
ncbi:type VI secretion system baseplate subunit TssE [Paraburkholderia bryophila]|jgi:type VI secretion system protein|uniref:Type VI secretion system protein n=1 Tax=Paraburkholderia bryophila TaxID=420952 RepID=A0A329CTH1_9BURK|nr:type VI secretion system baseplate subunit TssE [Paraburkholderia bryophila]RAS37417.1 type VI secretion system protein [Paraburkholderia bryophila]